MDLKARCNPFVQFVPFDVRKLSADVLMKKRIEAAVSRHLVPSL
jgi:hypothetical protein